MGLIGLISDTHGLLRPSVFKALDGVELILHGGDVGDGVLEALAAVAPVRAVRGNTDPVGRPEFPDSIQETRDGLRIHVSHGHEFGVPTPDELLSKYDADVIVYGHTHRKLAIRVGNRWVVNPGAAGPRRFNVKPSVARMTLKSGEVAVEFVELDD